MPLFANITADAAAREIRAKGNILQATHALSLLVCKTLDVDIIHQSVQLRFGSPEPQVWKAYSSIARILPSPIEKTFSRKGAYFDYPETILWQGIGSGIRVLLGPYAQGWKVNRLLGRRPAFEEMREFSDKAFGASGSIAKTPIEIFSWQELIDSFYPKSTSAVPKFPLEVSYVDDFRVEFPLEKLNDQALQTEWDSFRAGDRDLPRRYPGHDSPSLWCPSFLTVINVEGRTTTLIQEIKRTVDAYAETYLRPLFEDPKFPLVPGPRLPLLGAGLKRRPF